MDVLPSTSRASTIVRFNVGGRIYEVAQSLLEQHPDTMLARIASDTWSPRGVGDDDDDAKKVDSGGDESDEKKSDGVDSGNNAPGDDKSAALFIERDGERFRYCLDYMRDGGTVHLPPTIPKDALLQDLAYYGFQDIDPSRFSVMGSLPMFKICFDNIDSHLKDFDKMFCDIDIETREIEMLVACKESSC
jgi:hypothetical protein